MGPSTEQPLHVAQEQLQGRGVSSGPDFCQNQGLGEICVERISPSQKHQGSVLTQQSGFSSKRTANPPPALAQFSVLPGWLMLQRFLAWERKDVLTRVEATP